jgi:hypothetical protein
MMIAQRLNSILPDEYIAQPSVRVGDMMEIDIAALERDSGRGSISRIDDERNLMVATWAPAPAEGPTRHRLPSAIRICGEHLHSGRIPPGGSHRTGQPVEQGSI